MSAAESNPDASIRVSTRQTRVFAPQLAVLAILAALAALAYAPTLTQPFIEDDYSNIILAQHYGPLSGWPEMLGDSVFRLRTTSWLELYALNRLFGPHAAPYYAVTILLHIANTWLVYALGAWRPLGYRLTAWAAAFFAVHERHQEAVMWISGSAELVAVFFGLLSFLCWLRFLERGGSLWYAVSLISFCLALLSKESAVIFAALLGLPLGFDTSLRRRAALLIPFAALAAAAAASIFVSRARSFRFQDGSFSLHAPVWTIWPSNFAELFWIWGLIGLISILAWKPSGYKTVLAVGLTWIGLSLIPYSFLTYSRIIPSRQTYLASIGVAIIGGFALLTFCDRYWSSRRALVAAVCAAIAVQNIGYLWTKKRAQFLERAAPAQHLIDVARKTDQPIYVECFPRPRLQAESAVELMVPGKSGSDLVWDAQEAQKRGAVKFCYSRP